MTEDTFRSIWDGVADIPDFKAGTFRDPNIEGYIAAQRSGASNYEIVPIPWRSVEQSMRLVMWSVGLLGWFGGGVISFAHALS